MISEGCISYHFRFVQAFFMRLTLMHQPGFAALALKQHSIMFKYVVYQSENAVFTLALLRPGNFNTSLYLKDLINTVLVLSKLKK